MAKLSKLCKSVVSKLAQADSKSKLKYDEKVGEFYEFRRGDEVLVKNRAAGVLESKFVGPFWFIRYKDFDGYACILETADGM